MEIIPPRCPKVEEVEAKITSFLDLITLVFDNCSEPGANGARRSHHNKDMGNGLPLGAVVTTPEIASVMAQRFQFNTYGGNHVCSAGGHAVLRVLNKEKCQEHCTEVGSHLIERLRALKQRHYKLGILVGIFSIYVSQRTMQSCCHSSGAGMFEMEKVKGGSLVVLALSLEMAPDSLPNIRITPIWEDSCRLSMSELRRRWKDSHRQWMPPVAGSGWGWIST